MSVCMLILYFTHVLQHYYFNRRTLTRTVACLGGKEIKYYTKQTYNV